MPEGPAPGKPPANPVVPPAAPRRTAVPARLQAAGAQLVAQAQYRIARLGVVGQAGLAALATAVVLALSAVLPAQHALETATADLARARHSPAAASAGAGTPQLLATLPTRTQMPAVIGQVFTEAKGAGVSLDTGHYVYTAAKGGTIAHYKKGRLEYDMFVAKMDSANHAAITLPDWQKALAGAKLVPSFGGYFGEDNGRPVFVFSKGDWIAGVAGLPEKQADLEARTLASRLN